MGASTGGRERPAIGLAPSFQGKDPFSATLCSDSFPRIWAHVGGVPPTAGCFAIQASGLKTVRAIRGATDPLMLNTLAAERLDFLADVTAHEAALLLDELLLEEVDLSFFT